MSCSRCPVKKANPEGSVAMPDVGIRIMTLTGMNMQMLMFFGV